MTIPQTSRKARPGLVSDLRFHPLLLAAIVAGLAACSSDGSTAPGARGDVRSDGTPNGRTTVSMPAASPSEGQQVTASGTSVEETATGVGGATALLPDDGTAGNEGNPNAEDPAPAMPSAGCGRARTLQDGLQTIASGGMNRSYLLETPDAYDSTHPHRVIFMFHWNYGSINAIVNPPDADRNTDRPFYGMGDLADDETIFVVPQGLVGVTGGAGWDNPDGRDVNFTDDMLAAISSDLCIDTSRVFTTGFSYGASMSVALACVRADKFRAAVVYAPAFVSGVNAAECATPIAFFESHGVDDPIINYSTGSSILDTFTRLNGCTAMTPPDPPADGHTCVSYEGCTVPTRFCNFGAGQGNPFNTSLRGHYPSAKDPGQTTSWVPAEAWSFITQF